MCCFAVFCVYVWYRFDTARSRISGYCSSCLFTFLKIVLTVFAADSLSHTNCDICTVHSVNRYVSFNILLTDKYAEIEKQLIDDFRRAYYDGDLQRMKNITAILTNFKVIVSAVVTTLIKPWLLSGCTYRSYCVCCLLWWCQVRKQRTKMHVCYKELLCSVTEWL